MDRGEMTRRRILEASVDLLGREGPDGFSASALAREAGVSKATLFHHFDSLAEIPEVALEELFMAMLVRSDTADTDLRGYLDQMMREALEVMHHQPGFLNAYFVFLTKALFDPQLKLRFVAGSSELIEAFREGIEARLPEGTPEEEAYEIARLLGAALDGVALHHMVLEDHDVLDRGWSRLVDLLDEKYGRPASDGD